MSAPDDDRARGPDAARRYGVTVGADHTQSSWTDRRHLSWPELARLLTAHRVGPKAGPCIVPALLRGERRRQDEADRIDVALLDADAGHSLEEITSALTARGWRVAIASTHSHLTTRTTVKAARFDRWLAEHPGRGAADYLIATKHMLPRVAEGARLVERVVERDGGRDVEFCVLEHAPCPKFRVAVPLARPWRAADYPDQAAANAAWRERIAALAHALGLRHDESCADSSRLFFLPRHPEGTRPESRVLEGAECDLWGLPPAPGPDRSMRPGPEARDGFGANGAPRHTTYTDPATGEVIDLTDWAGRYADRFEVATALECHAPGVFGGRVSGVKRHLECPFEDEHTSPGRDGTYAVNASEIGHAGLTRRSRGFYLGCSHNACAGRDRLDLLAGLLERGWLTAADLTDPRFRAPADDPPAGSATDLERARERVEAVVERTREDPGAPFEPDNLVVLAGLAKRDEAAYQRARAGLKRAGVRMGDLERAVRRAGLRVIEGGAGCDGGEVRAMREAGPYLVTPAGITALRKETRDGPMIVPLATFVARIVAEEVQDDGAERRAVFAIEGELPGGRPLLRIEVPAERFAVMTWVAEQWGTEPVILAGQGTRDHFRAAVQMLSGGVPRRTVYGHLGWRRIGDGWLFLHAAGAIGARGAAADIEVDAGGERLAAYALPAPPEGEELRQAVRASLGLLDLGPNAVTVPLLGATYRAPLGEAAPVDFAVHLAGPTGTFKSEMAALTQAHFGPAFSGRHLPASWADTANALEKKAFLSKDAVLVVDDFAPGGTTADVQRLHREADRLVRAAGNRSGRARMAADGALRPTYFPRGLIVSTGEDTPAGQSLRARLLVVEVAPGAIRADRLTHAQGHAATGRLAGAMAGYLRWLAPRLNELKETLPERQRALRDEAVRGGAHRRTPEIAASLLLGWQVFLEFAEVVGAIDAEEAAALLGRARAALGEATGAQAAQQASEEPAARFLALLGAALASGRAHLADPRTGREPAEPQRWGWRSRTVHAGPYERTEWAAEGERVGWLDGDDVLLDPDAAYATVQRLARDQGTSLPVTARTLWKRLAERGLLASRDAGRGTNTIRRRLLGQRREIIHLHAETLFPETDRPDPPDPRPGVRLYPEVSGWSASAEVGSAVTRDTDPTHGPRTRTNGAAGRLGQVGQPSGEGCG